MTNNNLPEPQYVLDNFLKRDYNAIEELQWSRPGNIETRMRFTEARCEDTAAMVVYILRYLAKHHQQHEHQTTN
jgi:hypothetical protein